MEKYLVAIFRNSDRLRYDLTRVAYPRYFAAGTRSIIMLPVAPLIFDHGVPTRFELFSVDRGRDLFPVKRLREERIPPSFHFHLLSKHFTNGTNGTFGILLTIVSSSSSSLNAALLERVQRY